jgi:hypothetical protein
VEEVDSECPRLNLKEKEWVSLQVDHKSPCEEAFQVEYWKLVHRKFLVVVVVRMKGKGKGRNKGVDQYMNMDLVLHR